MLETLSSPGHARATGARQMRVTARLVAYLLGILSCMIPSMVYAQAISGGGTLVAHSFDETTHGTATGTLNVSPPHSATPAVTSDDDTWYTSENASTNYPHFHITNNGNTAASYTLAYSCSGNVSSCSVSSPSPTVTPGGTVDIAVYYRTGPFTSGSATVGLSATSPYSEVASKSITVVPLSEAVAASPKNGSASVSIPGAESTVPFTVTDMGNSSPVTYHITFACTGVVTTCPASYDLPVASGSPETRYPQFWVSANLAGGTGTITMTASYSDGFNNYSDYGSYTVTVPDTKTYNVAVTPTAFDDYTAENVLTNYGFVVTNNGTTGATYSLGASCTGGETNCVLRQSSLFVGANSSVTEYVDFNTSAAGSTGYVSLTASGPSNGSTGQIHVIPLSEAVSVSAGTSSTTIGQNASQSLDFTVSAVGNYTQPVTYTDPEIGNTMQRIDSNSPIYKQDGTV